MNTIWRNTWTRYGGTHENNMEELMNTIWRNSWKQYGGTHENNMVEHMKTISRNTWKQYGGTHENNIEELMKTIWWNSWKRNEGTHENKIEQWIIWKRERGGGYGFEVIKSRDCKDRYYDKYSVKRQKLKCSLNFINKVLIDRKPLMKVGPRQEPLFTREI